MKQRLYTKTRTEFTGWPDKGYDELYTDYVGEALKDYETDMVLDIKRIMETLVTSVRKQGFIKSN